MPVNSQTWTIAETQSANPKRNGAARVLLHNGVATAGKAGIGAMLV
jgi:hypothetical protein